MRPRSCSSYTTGTNIDSASLYQLLDKNKIDVNNHNWASFYQRCYIDTGTFFIEHASTESWKNYIRYSRMQKVASSTICEGMQRLKRHRQFGINKYKQNIHDINQYNYNYNKEYEFTFVRNPMSRFFSAFHEVNVLGIRRCLDANDDENGEIDMSCNDQQTLGGINMHQRWDSILSHYKNNNVTGLLKEWINIMYDRQLNWMMNDLNFYSHLNSISYWRYYYFFNFHVYPNVLRLFHIQSNNWNFIGNIQTLNQDLPKILSPYLKNKTRQRVENNADKFMKRTFYHQHDRYSIHQYREEMTQAFVKDISDLKIEIDGDEYINKLCQIYWIDFMCLPFQVPDECNLTQMYKQHYKKHIEYKQCV